MNSNDTILSLRPRQLTVGEVRQLLKKRDHKARKTLADLVRHRLKDRYITPLEKVPVKYKSGFLIMAACCLLIETFQCFKDGKKDTKGKRLGEAAFKQFFSDHSGKFASIDGAEFYKKIRCGILHQAQTEDGFRILRRGPIYDREGKAINAAEFMKTLKAIVEEYVDTLHRGDMNEAPWPNARAKITFICDAA